MLKRLLILIKVLLVIAILMTVHRFSVDVFHIPTKFKFKNLSITLGEHYGQILPVQISMPSVFNVDTIVALKSNHGSTEFRQNSDAKRNGGFIYYDKREADSIILYYDKREADSIISIYADDPNFSSQKNIRYLKVRNLDNGYYFDSTFSINGPSVVTGNVEIRSTSTVKNIVLSLNSYLGFAKIILILFLLLRILQSLKRKEAFTISTVKNVRLIGVILFLAEFVKFAVSVVQSNIIPLIQYKETFGPVISMNITSDFSFTALFIGMLLFLLAEIFEMGYEMKKEQDLTI